MRRLPLICALALPLFFAQAAQAAPVLNVLNWNDYIDPSVIADFEKERGVKVNYSFYSDSESAEKKLRGPGAVDVMVTAYERLPGYLAEDLLQPLGMDVDDHMERNDRRVITRLVSSDPGMKHSAPYLWGKVGIAINKTKVSQVLGGDIPNSWSLLFDPVIAQKLSACGISMLSSQDDVLNIYSNYKGLQLESMTRRAATTMMRQLNELKTNYAYIDSERYVSDLAEGKVCVAMAWLGDAISAQEAEQDVDFIMPDEGTMMFMDVMVIPKKSTKQALARDFIKFMQRDDNMERNARFTYYLSPNLFAQQNMEKEDRFDAMRQKGAGSLMTYVDALPTVQPLLDAEWSTLVGQ